MSNVALIGADPEAFVMRGGVIAHCIGILGGTKDAPRVVQYGAVQEDNVLFEFNIDPCDNVKDFKRNIGEVMAQGADILMDYGLRLKAKTSSHIYESLQGFPEKAFEFGCTPDYNAMTGEANPRPSAENQLLRTAGGHVHIGWSHLRTVTELDQRGVMQLCDYELALRSMLEDPDTLRRELYGKAGACRLKSYGAEYRTLSNYWIWDEATITSVYERAQRAVQKYFDGQLPLYQAVASQADVQNIINTNDVVSARAILEVLDHATN